MDIVYKVGSKTFYDKEEAEIYENLPFLEKTAEQYERVIEEYSSPEKSCGMEILRVDASRTKEEVTAEILGKIRSMGLLQEN